MSPKRVAHIDVSADEDIYITLRGAAQELVSFHLAIYTSSQTATWVQYDCVMSSLGVATLQMTSGGDCQIKNTQTPASFAAKTIKPLSSSANDAN